MSSLINRNKKSSKEPIFTVLRQVSYIKLFKKYSSGEYAFDRITINNLIFNETCLAVARFKDFLIYDDYTEFLRHYYPPKDCNHKLKKILTFYETYSKIFPNYLVIKENKYLYRNIRKKQKMIDAINQIKREEKENKKKLSEKNGCKKKNSGKNELFSQKVKEEIKKFQNNISFKNYKNSFDTDKGEDETILMNQNSISISILNWKQYEQNSKFNDNMENDNNNWGTNIDSFITNQTNKSISIMLNALNDDKIYTKDLQNILLQYNKNIIKNNNNKNIIQNQSIKTDKTKNNIIKTNDSIKNENKMNKKTITNGKILNKHIIKRSTYHKNNNDLNNKISNNIKNINKYVKTSTNATNSSSILSKMIKNQISSSSICKNKNKESKENKDSNKETKKDNNNDKKNNLKNIILPTSPVNTKTNIYQKSSPKIEKFKLKKNFFKTNNNFNRHKNKNRNNSEKNEKKGKKSKKNVYSVQNTKNNIEKKYTKCKHISQDFDSGVVSKVTNNLLTNKEKEKEKNYFTENNNPNLITGNTKMNEKNIVEEKVHVNVRDIIKENKEKEKEKENKGKINKMLQTAQKLKNKKEDILKLSKTKTNSNIHFNIHKTTRSLNMIDNQKRYNSLFSKQKIDKMKNKNINKKLMTKQQKSKTNAIFAKNRIKTIDNKNSLKLKNDEDIKNNKKDENKDNINKDDSKVNNKDGNKDNNTNNNKENNNNKDYNIINNNKVDNKDNNNKVDNKDNNNKCISKDNNIDNNKDNNTNFNNKKDNDIDNKKVNNNKNDDNNIETIPKILDEQKQILNNTKSDPDKDLLTNENNNITEREISSNLSYSNNTIKIKKNNLTPDKINHMNFRTKNLILKRIKNTNYFNLNKSAKIVSNDIKKKFKTFLVKKNTKLNYRNNSNSQKNVLSINILSRIQEIKKNRTKNNFYKTKKKNTNNIINLVKTPGSKSNKIEFFKKNNTNRKFKNSHSNKKNEESKNNYMSSFSIKVNRTYFNKNKDNKEDKNKDKNKQSKN